MPEIKVRQEEIQVEGKRLFVTYIPTPTSGGWYTVHDLFEMWAAVAIDLDGTVLGWRNPPDEEPQAAIEEAVKKAFGLPAKPGHIGEVLKILDWVPAQEVGSYFANYQGTLMSCPMMADGSMEQIDQAGEVEVFDGIPSWVYQRLGIIEQPRDQLMPAPDEAPLTDCPWCGVQYNVKEDDCEDFYETVLEPTPNTHEVARHKACGHLVRFIPTGGDSEFEYEME